MIDLHHLAAFKTITFNRAYIAWRDWGFEPTYHACFDPVAIEDNRREFKAFLTKAGLTRFFFNRTACLFGLDDSSRVILVELVEGGGFSTDWNQLGDFGNVGASSLQILTSLGYVRVLMVGVDGRYSILDDKKADGDGMVRVNDDPDHFTPDYARGKRRLASPDFEKLLGRWPEVAEACRARGVEVRNASPGSALTCFPKVDFIAGLDWLRGAERSP